MTSQLFVKPGPPNSLLYTLLQNTCYAQTDKCFIVTLASYKKGVFTGSIESFYKELAQYYQKSKMFYLTRKNSYKKFLTIIRQLCNWHNIMYTNEIIYEKSTYEINYKIFVCESMIE